MEADLLKKAEQTPKNLEMLMLIEMNAKILEKHQIQLDDNIHTQVMLNEANKKIDKLQEDVEKLIRKIVITNGRSNGIVNVCWYRKLTEMTICLAYQNVLRKKE